MWDCFFYLCSMKNLLFILSLTLLLVASSCKKYEDGPSFSLRSKKERLSNNWKINKYFVGDVDKTDAYTAIHNKQIFTISKSGLYTLSYDSSSVIKVDQGIWRFADAEK